MRILQPFLQSCATFLGRFKISEDIEVYRQNTPPDEGCARAQEELAASVSHANKCAEIQAWELVRN
jgi:hypothetical protein